MAHYAILDENDIVTQVITGVDEGGDIDWELHYANIYNASCKRTSYNTYGGIHYTREITDTPGIQNLIVTADQSKAFRKNYAGIGFKYDSIRDAFIEPKPFDSWILNEQTCLYDPPIPYPDDEYVYIWDEQTTSWVLQNE